MPQLPADAALLPATKRHLIVHHIVYVDPHPSRLQPFCCLNARGNVAGVDVCGQAVIRVVGQLYGLINSLEFHYDKKVITGIVTQNDFRDLGLNIDHVEGFSSIIMNILGVKAGVILVELKDNIKVSFRSKGNILVSELAKEFAGGGHKNAAGANVKGTTIPELKKDILNKLEKYLIN